MIEISQAHTSETVSVVRDLFREYQKALGIDLSFQCFESELASLPGDYISPLGRLLLAYEEERPAGCVAMRPLTDNICEMKRLYVRPLFRATGLGRQLAERVIAEARTVGYQYVYLDTLPMMEDAQRLYEKLGFTDIPAYRHNPIAGTRFLGLML